MISLTWFGTACYLLNIKGTKILFDPFFLRNDKATPALKTMRENVKDISAIFITHAHFDHITEAGYFAETLDCPVYCSEIAKDNIIRWSNGEIFKEHKFPLSETGKNNIIPIENFQKIQVTKDVSVESIKSRHIVFDKWTVESRVASKEFTRQAFKLSPLLKNLPKGEVFGFCTSFKDKKIVSFGSLCAKYPKILNQYSPCDIFIAPTAGNSSENIAIKGGKMTEALQAKIVVPVHWDDFFPPISWTVDLNPYLKYVEENIPATKVIIPEIDKEISLDLD